ncbi:integrase, catalytic region, zinc finger, CCHC-type containing protein [Tanacetum coccineum]
MRNIKMTMSRMQLNSKFVNNMLPEWGRFVTAVKLNRGLRDSNYDQLYAYLKQYEAHANENKMMLDRFTQHTVDPLALMSNVSHQQYYLQSSTTPPSTYVPPHFLPQTNNQLRTSSNTRNQATVQDGRVVVQNVQGRQNRGQGNNARGGGAAGYGGAQNRVGNANPGQARQIKCYNCNGIGHIARNCTQPKCPQNSEYFKDKMLLMQAQENGVTLDEEQLLFIAGGQDNAIDEDVDEQPVQDLALNVDNVFQADDYDAFDSDVDEAPTAQTKFMANLSFADHVYDEAGLTYDSDILSEVHDHDHYQDAVCEHHEEHEMHDDVQPNNVVDLHADYTSDSNMIPYDLYVKDNVVPVVQSNVSSVPNDAYMMIYNDMYEPHAQSVSKTTRNTVVDNSLTAKLATYKEQVELYERRVNITPPNYSKENFLATFTPQKQLTPEQLFWSQDIVKMKAEALKEQNTRPIKALTVYPPNTPATLVPRVLPTKSQVKINIFTLRQLFSDFEKTSKKRITPTGITEGERGFEQTKTCYLTEVIPFFKTLQEHFEGIQKAITKEVKEMSDAFDELETELDQSSVDRKHDEIELKNLLIEHDNIIAEGLSKEVFYAASNSELNVSRFTEMQKAHNVVKARCLELEAELSNLRDNVLFNQQDKQHANTPRKKQVNFEDQIATSSSTTHKHVEPMHTQKSNVPVPPSIGKHYATDTPHDEVLPNLLAIQSLQEQIMVMASAFKPLELRPGPGPNLLTPGPISSGLVPNPAPAIPYLPPTNKELEIPHQVIPTATGPSVSIAIDLDVPSGSHTSSPLDHHSSLVHHGVAGEQCAEVNPFAAADPEPFVNVFASDYNSEASSSGEMTIPESNPIPLYLMNISEMDQN